MIYRICDPDGTLLHKKAVYFETTTFFNISVFFPALFVA